MGGLHTHLPGVFHDISPYDQDMVQKRNKIVDIICTLNQDEIDMLKLRKLLFWGVPKIGSGEDHITNVKSDDVVRPLLWRLMTDVLPPQPSKWAETEK